MIKRFGLLAILSLQVLLSQAWADSRLDKIRETQTIIIGYFDGDFPFTYQNPQQHTTGFGIDLANVISQSIAKELKLNSITLKFQKLTHENRFDLLNQGKADISCGTHSNIPSHHQSINFSHNFFVAKSRLLVPIQSDIKGYKDMEGKRVGFVKNSPIMNTLSSKAKQFKFGEMREVASLEEGLNLMEHKELEAFVEADILLQSALAQKNLNHRYHFVGQALTIEHYACILPFNDKTFKETVDYILALYYLNGSAERLFKQWFLAPIETENGQKVTLNFELSPSLKRLYDFPNDRPIGSE
ncbi:MAG: transporter substrate-binding domain-containing protein [Cardiobacteriaceae bacterium]|nr:transporter substrate-binding domain-containing protein [Cardiobacteriaceae bacterium]